MLKNAYALSYNKSKATANWVSWHVSAAWKGDAQRQNDFRPDSSFHKVGRQSIPEIIQIQVLIEDIFVRQTTEMEV
jgi:hypothetical protein